MIKSTRLAAFAIALVLILAACGDTISSNPSGDPTAPTTSPGGTSATTAPSGVLPEGASALRTRNDASFGEPLINIREIISGGPPPDGIPPIDDPKFIGVGAADDWIEDQEPVVAIEIDGDARAYPVQIMIWHEIVNDTVGGVPVAVTYCPLCNSAVSYRREVRGVETTFGTSGSLYASALVMYDRATESLWTHFDGRAVVGVLAGDQLETVGSPLIAWSDFKSIYPDGLVLDRDQTGFARRYGANPYVGYDDPATSPFLFRGALDNRALAKQRVVGVVIGDDASAFALEFVSGDGAKATNAVVGETPIVILWKGGQSTALEETVVYGGRDVGSVGVFLPEVDGEPVTIRSSAGVFVDDETGSQWDVAGKARSGPLAGAQLERIAHLDTFWFAWATYQPGTELIGDPNPSPP